MYHSFFVEAFHRKCSSLSEVWLNLLQLIYTKPNCNDRPPRYNTHFLISTDIPVPDSAMVFSQPQHTPCLAMPTPKRFSNLGRISVSLLSRTRLSLGCINLYFLCQPPPQILSPTFSLLLHLPPCGIRTPAMVFRLVCIKYMPHKS